MISPTQHFFASKPLWARQLFICMVVVLIIGGATTLIIKQGLVRWPLTVATGPAMTGGADFLTTITKVFAEERPLVQLNRVKKENLAASAKAMEDGEADLAMVRSDIAMPRNGLTIAIFRRDNLVLITPGRSTLNSFQGLSNKSIGLLKSESPERNEAMSRLLDGVLSFYNISPGKLKREFLTLDEIGPAIADKRVAAVLVLGPAGPGPISKVMATVSSATNTSAKLIGDKQSTAIARTIPGTEPNEIEAGAFGGAKPKPEEDLSTLAVTYRLVGRHSLPDFVTGEIARLLTLAKARLLSTSPMARNIEAPDSDDGSGFPIHPGAAAYFDGEQNSLLDSAFNIFYLASIVLGLVGSGLVWLFNNGKNGAGTTGQIEITRLSSIMREAKNADQTTLDQLEIEIDEMITRSLEQGKGPDAEQTNAITVVTRQLDKRREKLLSAH
jgi:TRAP-type uncharacterized transport system substrate-binding protein